MSAVAISGARPRPSSLPVTSALMSCRVCRATAMGLLAALLLVLSGISGNVGGGSSSSLLFVEGKKSPSSSRHRPPPRGPSGAASASKRKRAAPTSPRRRPYEDEDYDEDYDDEAEVDGLSDDKDEDDAYGMMDDDLYDEDEEEGYDEEEEEVLRPMHSSSRRGASGGGRGSTSGRRGPPPPPSRKKAGRTKGGGSSGSRRYRDEFDYDEEDEDYYDREPPPRSSRRGGPPPRRGSSRGGRYPPPRRGGPQGRRGRGRNASGGQAVVPYVNRAAGTFTRGIASLREYVPDPAALRDSTASALSATKKTTLNLSRGIYREVKGLTSSELEQVMLKATKPDDSPVKGKHVERLVGVTYQISPRYDIYDSVLRKLWKKMAEPDWRTTLKALYVLHRFSVDGSPDHQPALKARLRELRRTRDPKRKEKFFNSKQILAGDSTPENAKYRAFLARYAHYVLLRAQCFGGMFMEIAPEDPVESSSSSSRAGGKKSSKQQSPPAKAPKPITATALRPEHLEPARLLLKAGCACALRDGEECENTCIAVERVAADMMGLTTAVAVALNRALKPGSKQSADADPAIVKRWCEFYSEECLPQTKAMVKKTSPKLDAYGLFLPSRMGATVSRDLLQKGLRGEEQKEEEVKGTVEGAPTEEKVGDQGERKGADGETVVEAKKERQSPEGPVEKSKDQEPKKESAPEKEIRVEVEEDEYEEYDYEDEYYDEEA